MIEWDMNGSRQGRGRNGDGGLGTGVDKDEGDKGHWEQRKTSAAEKMIPHE